MRTRTTVALGAAAWLLAVSTAGADVRLTMENGRVSLVAKDATLRQILAEWARVGQAKVVNAEGIPNGQPLSLELSNVSEQQALDVLLRSASGYLLAPRATLSPNLSRFDRVIVMPPSVAPRNASSGLSGGGSGSGSGSSGAVLPQPQVFPQPQLEAPVDEDGPSIPPARGPLFPSIAPQMGSQQGPIQGNQPGFQAGPMGESPSPPPGAPQMPVTSAFPGAVIAPPSSSTGPAGAASGRMGTSRPGQFIPAPPPGQQTTRPQQ